MKRADLDQLFLEYIHARNMATRYAIRSDGWNFWIGTARRNNALYRAIEPRPVAP